MDKYDLEAVPVVDELGRLVGRICIDDVIDVIKEEIEKGDTEDIQKFGVWKLLNCLMCKPDFSKWSKNAPLGW